MAMDTVSSSILPGSSRQTEDLPEIPPTFTPSIKKVLRKSSVALEKVPAPLPTGIDVATMKSRLKGKKTKWVTARTYLRRLVFTNSRGTFLTPQEMASLTESWKPFRSVGQFLFSSPPLLFLMFTLTSFKGCTTCGL
jgi:DNA-3-methyladenine glycosylase II